ncbi:protein sorting system archaetidylserine decarboxylase [Haladaptatus sp. GCM10025707]|uniref:protein sorting system archaetidylserine decarboxylase n=1 Tax=unclassified Haladaptatus TaxID=2622732 RepID=UPI0023E88A53|nr:protein sorting system archaetidylserine decarboxylase [Haladaptatus sp. QDMS2]
MTPGLAPDGLKFAVVAFLAGLAATIFSPIGALFGLLLSGSVLLFYRDPERDIVETGVAAPADGKVSVIRREGDQVRVGTYMSARDVHVNRAPLAGTVQSVTHKPGGYKLAFSKESDNNEQLHIEFEDYTVVLIAGWFARRIHPYVEVGDTVEKGDRIGHISFGSRADVLLPPDVIEEMLTVEQGDRVRAGSSMLARGFKE